MLACCVCCDSMLGPKPVGESGGAPEMLPTVVAALGLRWRRWMGSEPEKLPCAMR